MSEALKKINQKTKNINPEMAKHLVEIVETQLDQVVGGYEYNRYTDYSKYTKTSQE
jgi:hypothetical protein